MYTSWTKEEDNLLKQLLESGKYKYENMLPFFKERTLRALCTRARFIKTKNKFTNQLYFYNEKYFSEYTLENCYFAGVFMADACIHKTKGNNNSVGFTWSVSEKDIDLVQLFCDKVNYTGPIKKYKKSCQLSTSDKNKEHEQTKIYISNCKWINDLANKFGITQDKIYRNVPQNFPTLEHELAFLIGLLDGDGAITCSQKNITTFQIMLCSSSLPTLEWFKNLIKRLDLPSLSWRENKIFKPNGENCYYFYVRGVEAAFLFEKLKSINVPKLDRKWNNPDILSRVEFCKNKYYISKKKDPKKSKVEDFIDSVKIKV